MRLPIRSTAVAVMMAGVAGCAQSEAPQPRHAVAAPGYATPAVAVEPQVGYPDEARHVADCLVAHSTYDFRTDLYRTASGSARRCTE
jgi:hypothetical protein